MSAYWGPVLLAILGAGLLWFAAGKAGERWASNHKPPAEEEEE